MKGVRPQNLLSPETLTPGRGEGPSPHASQVSSQLVPAGRDQGHHTHDKRDAGARRRWFFKLRGASGHGSASVTAALHENSFDVYWGNNENFI